MENLGPLNVPLSFWGTAAIALLATVLWIAGRGIGREAAGWTALALVGQACALQLVLAGPTVRPQIFRGWNDLLNGPRVVFVAAVVAQAVIVIAGLRSHWPAILPGASRILSWPMALALSAVLIFSATTMPMEVALALASGSVADLVVQAGGHASKFALSLFLLITGFLSLLLAAATVPTATWERLERWWRTSSRQWLPWAAAGWVVVVSSMLAWLVLERIPHIGDEWTYLFQAKHLALGQFWLPPPPDAEAFMVPLTYQDPTRWLNANMIGWPVVLSVGVRLGIPWMINPLLAGTAILLAHALVRRIYERTVADAVVLLMAASPWLLWISASLMSHALSLVLVLLVMLGVSRARQRGAVSWGAVAGSSCGALLHTRPLEAVVVALVAGVWWLAAGQRRLRVPAVAAAIVCGGAMVALFLAYNQSVTGNAFQTPLNAFYDAEFHKGSNRLGFGADIGNWGWIGLDALPGHGPIDVLMNTNQNLHMVQFDLFGWAFGSITLVYFLGVWRRRRLDAFMWVWLGGAIAGLNLYWFSGGPDFGARYWYMAIIPFTVLAVRGAQELSAHFVQIGRTAAASRVWAFVVLATAIGTTNLLVWRSLDKYLNYRGARPDIRRLATEHTFGRSLVLIRGRLWPNYGSAAPLNPIWLGNDGVVPIYARELTRESVAKLRAYYADRPVWIIAGPTATEPRFHVVAGPIAPGVPLPAAAQPEQSSADDQPRGPDDPPHRR